MSNQPAPSPLPRLPERAPESHKGQFGRALLIGGSRGMTGAIALAGMAALRSGAGLVTLAVPDECLGTVATHEPSYMTVGLNSDDHGRIANSARQVIKERAAEATCIACGPGLGRSTELNDLVAWLYTSVAHPMVLDADALNALASQPAALASPGGERIMTPHPGEFRRLVGEDSLSLEACRNRAPSDASKWHAVVVLKGHRTLVTDGRRVDLNSTGNPGMATGGSGDVLTGVVTALVCQGMEPYDAARLGVHIHGLAGDLAATDAGEISLIASDLVRWLPRAFRTST